MYIPTYNNSGIATKTFRRVSNKLHYVKMFINFLVKIYYCVTFELSRLLCYIASEISNTLCYITFKSWTIQMYNTIIFLHKNSDTNIFYIISFNVNLLNFFELSNFYRT